jgi:hypothetical protein
VKGSPIPPISNALEIPSRRNDDLLLVCLTQKEVKSAKKVTALAFTRYKESQIVESSLAPI